MTNSLQSKSTLPPYDIGMTVKQLSKFFACLIGTIAMCLCAYTLIVDALVEDTEVPATYKWFLLKDVPGPRIIFESGSNSHHAIDTDALGQALGMTAINIADNGGYALEDKVTRLETYTRPGDIVILPLEWTFYHREKLTDDYVDTLFTTNRDYYRAMPVTKRIKRALSLPPKKIIEQISKKKNRAALVIESPAQQLFISVLTRPTGYQSHKETSGPALGVAEQSCDDYVLGKANQRADLTLGRNIKPALNRLKALKARGVDIHFAWPVLAGDGCLSDPAFVTGFRTEIEEAVNKAGFEFLGTPSQSLYGQNFRYDTPYHITTEGAYIHTAQMISFLKAQGYGTSAEPFDIKTFARHRLLELELAQVSPISQPAIPIGEVIAMESSQQQDYVDFTAGWWAFEPYGRWMRDNRAMFRLTLPVDIAENSVLKVQGITKSGRGEHVNVSINGELVNGGMFGEGAALLIPVATLPVGTPLSIFLSLPNADIPKSPLERGQSEDARSMTLHLQTIELIATADDMPALPVAEKLVERHAGSAEVQNASLPVSAVFDKTESSTENFMTRGATVPPIVSAVTFTSGWWDQETYGRWMKGREANFEIELPDHRTGLKVGRYELKLRGDFFMGRTQSISLMIDGQEMGTLKEAGDGTITALFKVTGKASRVTVNLKLPDGAAQSPKALGVSNDDRTLTYFLKAAQVRNMHTEYKK